MSLEKDYNDSYRDTSIIVGIVESLSIHFDWQIQKIKKELKTKSEDEVSGLDIEYIILTIDEINKDISILLSHKVTRYKEIVEEKLPKEDEG